MNYIKYSINLLLFCIFPLRLLLVWLPMQGYPILATFIAMIEFLCIIILLFDTIFFGRNVRKNIPLWFFNVLYWIFSAYLLYYIIIQPLMPRQFMLQVPLENKDVIQNIITIGMVCPLISNYLRYVNNIQFSKMASIFLYFVLIIYIIIEDVKVYFFLKTTDEVYASDYGLVDALTIGQYSIMAFIFGYWARNEWTSNKIINSLIIWLMFLFTFILLLVLTQRGPILFFVITFLILFLVEKGINVHSLSLIVVSIWFLTIFYDELLSLISSISPEIVGRFLSILGDGGSGRFGDTNSEYYLAFEQISNNPYWGSYFRTLSGFVGGRYGNYPHNFVLELLMTFGVIFTIPFLWVTWCAIKNSYYAIRNHYTNGVWGLLLFNILLCHLTSYTICFDVHFWCSIALALSIRVKKGDKRYRHRIRLASWNQEVLPAQ